MTDAATQELIERLGQENGPDRDADFQIWLAIQTQATRENSVITTAHSEGDLVFEERCVQHGRVQWKKYHKVPLFTKSIDAALTLVPEGCCWGLFDEPTAWVWPTPTRDLLSGFQAKAATPAIALCIAALKARQATGSVTANQGENT